MSAASQVGRALGWCLQAGQACTLQSRDAVELRVLSGRIWATLDGPHGGPANDRGDRVLQAGERLPLRPGQRVVVEAWPADGSQQPACLVWNTPPADAPRWNGWRLGWQAWKAVRAHR